MFQTEPVFSIFHDNAIYRPLIRDFTRNLPQRTTELEQAVNAGDIEGIKFFAHRIKGAAASYGYPKLTSLAAEIEDKVRSLPPNHDDSALIDIERIMNDIKSHAEAILQAKVDE